MGMGWGESHKLRAAQRCQHHEPAIEGIGNEDIGILGDGTWDITDADEMVHAGSGSKAHSGCCQSSYCCANSAQGRAIIPYARRSARHVFRDLRYVLRLLAVGGPELSPQVPKARHGETAMP